MITDVEGALGRVADVLTQHRDVLDGRVTEPVAPRWCESRGWTSFLSALDDEALHRCEADGLASAIDALPRAPGSLVALACAVREVTALGRVIRTDEPSVLELRGASPRKRAQVAALTGAAREMACQVERVVDVGAGHGHLTRALAGALGVPALGIDRDAARVARARELGARRRGLAEFAVHNGRAGSLPLRTDDLAVGLHACGALGDALTIDAARARAHLILVSCCVQKIGGDARAPLSDVGTRRALGLARDVLGLANLFARDHGVERSMRTIMAARQTRHALRLLLRARGVDVAAGEETHGINRRRMTRGLAHVAGDALRKRGLEPATTDEIVAANADADTQHGRIRRLSLPRSMLGRVVELAVVLDRAQYLAEAGYRVRVGPLFDPATSPRNLAISARAR